jgi:hypothetical protein
MDNIPMRRSISTRRVSPARYSDYDFTNNTQTRLVPRAGEIFSQQGVRQGVPRVLSTRRVAKDYEPHLSTYNVETIGSNYKNYTPVGENRVYTTAGEYGAYNRVLNKSVYQTQAPVIQNPVRSSHYYEPVHSSLVGSRVVSSEVHSGINTGVRIPHEGRILNGGTTMLGAETLTRARPI